MGMVIPTRLTRMSDALRGQGVLAEMAVALTSASCNKAPAASAERTSGRRIAAVTLAACAVSAAAATERTDDLADG